MLYRWLILILIIAAHPAWASSARQQLVDYLDNYNALKAEFSQKVLNSRGVMQGEAKGTMAVKRPDHFRWHIKSPYDQVMIANGRTLWIYDKNLEQVTIRTMEAKTKINPATLLSGDVDDYIDAFSVVRLKEGGYVGFRLEPKTEGDVLRSLTLYFVNGTLKKMRIIDQFGQRNIYKFRNIQVNPELKNEIFKFKVPKGVDVVDNRDAD